MSRLFVIGLSHRTAPLDVREALSVSGDALRRQLREAAALCGEAMVLSTCNRYELYGSLPEDGSAAALTQIETLITAANPAALSHLYKHQGEDALRHLFRVAASLDSMVLGEPQILGQVKAAFKDAEDAGTVGSVLGGLLPRAFAVAKRVRSETAIGENAASVASVAVDLAGQIFGELRGQPVLLVGAGKMAELCARHLRESSADQFLVINRTRARADELAARLGGTSHDFSELESLLGRAAVVLCSTGSREPVLRTELLTRVMKARRGRWLLLIDIAVPRDVEPSAAGIDNLYLYDIDALQEVVAGNLEERQREAATAEQLVAGELLRMNQRGREGDVVPLIKSLRAYAQGVAQAEIARVMPRLAGVPERERKLVAQLGDAIVNKLLHGPLTALKKAASESPQAGADLAEAVRRLFPVTATDTAPPLAELGQPIPLTTPERAPRPELSQPGERERERSAAAPADRGHAAVAVAVAVTVQTQDLPSEPHTS